MTVPAKSLERGEVIERVIANNDLSKLSVDERNQYYVQVCRSLGLNPLTQPFAYITLNGKLTLYAKRDCADQLRKINNISISIVSQNQSDGLLTVHVKARDGNGREDEDLGIVNFPDTLRGDLRANAILKAVTKAKRRVTLSISGLGFLDETEVEDIPAAARRSLPPKPNVMLPHDEKTGEIIEHNSPQPTTAVEPLASVSSPPSSPPEADGLSLLDMGREAAMRGEAVFKKFYHSRNKSEQGELNAIGDELRGLMAEADVQS